MLQAVFQELEHDTDNHAHPPIAYHQCLRRTKEQRVSRRRRRSGRRSLKYHKGKNTSYCIAPSGTNWYLQFQTAAGWVRLIQRRLIRSQIEAFFNPIRFFICKIIINMLFINTWLTANCVLNALNINNYMRTVKTVICTFTGQKQSCWRCSVQYLPWCTIPGSELEQSRPSCPIETNQCVEFLWQK